MKSKIFWPASVVCSSLNSLSRIAIGGLIFVYSFFLLGCGWERVNEEVETAMSLPVNESTAALEKIADKHPRNFKAKVNLAVLALINDDLPKAKKWAEAAESLVPKRRDPETVYVFHVITADIAARDGQYDQAVELARMALEYDQEDPLNAQLILARTSLAQGDKESALKGFDVTWEKMPELLREDDLNGYVILLAEVKRWDRALEVAYRIFEGFGYSPGTGVSLSALHENAGDMPLSVLTAFLDLRYAANTGVVTSEDVLVNLATLETTLTDLNMAGDGLPAIEAMRSIEEGRWSDSYRILSDMESENIVHRFWTLAAGLESGEVGREGIERYMAMEGFFTTYPEYYYRAARAFRKYRVGYDFVALRPVLEKVIIMAPQSEMAAESRRELSRLLLLNPEDADDLYLLHEQAAAIRQYASTERTEVLAPLVRLLDFENNPYTTSAETALRDLAGIPGIRSYLVEVQDATPKRRERITLILEGTV